MKKSLVLGTIFLFSGLCLAEVYTGEHLSSDRGRGGIYTSGSSGSDQNGSKSSTIRHYNKVQLAIVNAAPAAAQLLHTPLEEWSHIIADDTTLQSAIRYIQEENPNLTLGEMLQFIATRR